MKIIKRYFILLAIITFFTNCGGNGGDPAPIDPVQATIDGLSKTWNVSSVTLDGSSVSNDWSGVSFTFKTNKSFTVTGLSTENSLIWSSTGSYSFTDTSNPLKILRNDEIEIVISNLTDTSASLAFTINGRIGGRAAGLSGNYNFSFSN